MTTRKTIYKACEIHFIFDRLLVPEKEFTADTGKKRQWHREQQVAIFLLDKYGVEFWPNVNIGFRVRYLKYFKTGEGAKMLDEKYKQFLSIQPTMPKKLDKSEEIEYTRVTTTVKRGFRERFIE